MVTEITLTNIEEGLLDETGILLVLMCYGTTCGPCKFTIPHFQEAANFYSNITPNIKFYMINAWEPLEQRQFLEQMWEIKGVPTFKLIYNSEEVSSRSGGGDFNIIKEMVETGINETFNKFGVKI